MLHNDDNFRAETTPSAQSDLHPPLETVSAAGLPHNQIIESVEVLITLSGS